MALDARNAEFPAIKPLRPPMGAPNVVIVLIDDMGFGAPSMNSGPCYMPALEKIAENGLTYNRFHTTALCSPTRQASNTSLMLMMGIFLVLNVSNILAAIGTGVLVAAVIFIVVSFVIGYLLGGPGSDTKSVLGLGTGQRNIAAALVVVGQNFSDPDVLITLIVIAILGLFILMPLGGELGKRKVAKSESAV